MHLYSLLTFISPRFFPLPTNSTASSTTPATRPPIYYDSQGRPLPLHQQDYYPEDDPWHADNHWLRRRFVLAKSASSFVHLCPHLITSFPTRHTRIAQYQCITFRITAIHKRCFHLFHYAPRKTLATIVLRFYRVYMHCAFWCFMSSFDLHFWPSTWPSF